jgi:hypothetical protein
VTGVTVATLATEPTLLGRHRLKARLAGADIVQVYATRLANDAYARFVAGVWDVPGDLVVVEHDNDPTVGQLCELLDCGHRWCGFTYSSGGVPIRMGLGCSRLSAGLRAEYADRVRPTLVDRSVGWRSVDVALARMLLRGGERWVQHRGVVAHDGGRRMVG